MSNALEISQTINFMDELTAITYAEAVLAHCKETGLHTTLDEIKIWVEAVRKDRSLKMPPSHF